MTSRLILLAGFVLGHSQICEASTPEAWEEFEGRVRAASETLVEGIVLNTDIYVDPFGSESYGIAIIHGFDGSTSSEVLYVTVFNKETGSIEISGEILPSGLDWWRDLLDENRRLRTALETIKLNRS